jgi:polysaccharide biosynthesis transport protein
MAPNDSSIRDRTDHVDLVQAVRRRFPLVLICTAFAALGGLVYSLIQEEQYEATAEVLIESVSLGQSVLPRQAFPPVDPAKEAITDIELFTTQEVAEMTSEDLDRQVSPAEVMGATSAEAANASDVIEVTVSYPDPQLAADMANGMAENYIEFRREDQRSRIDQAEELGRADLAALEEEQRSGPQGRALRQQLARLTALKSLQTGDATVLKQATTPSDPVSLSPVRNTVFGGMLGLIVGVVLALLLHRVDRRARDSGEIEAGYELPLLGRVPASAALAGAPPLSLRPLRGSDAEAFRLLRSRLRYFNVDSELKSILVTSPASGDGKTTIAAGLAAASAAAGVGTVLVEADMHQSALADVEGVADGPGLAELLSGQASLDEVCRPVGVPGSGAASLEVIVAGSVPPNPAQLLESDRASELLRELGSRYSVVIIDAPPVTAVADAIPLTRAVDGVVVVGRIGRTTPEQARDLRGQLAGLDAEVLGAVANCVAADERLQYGSAPRDG